MLTSDRNPSASPVVRVEDAALRADDGPVRVTVSSLPSPQEVADALATAGARARVNNGRLTTITTPSRLVDATGRSLGRRVAEALEQTLEAALAAWHGPPPDLETPATTLPCSSRTITMGVLNVTPDSFFDGGSWYREGDDPEPAIAHGRALAAAGADIVDVGGESTRPGAAEVSEEEETNRTVPVIEALAADGITVSVDTRRASVAEAAVKAGATIVNDVSGGTADPAMLERVADLGVAYILMHMRGTPQTMQDLTSYEDVVAEVFDHLADRLGAAVAVGVDTQRIAVDPGIGFAKTAEQSLLLLRRLRELSSLGRPLLVGASRKSFIGMIAGAAEADARMPGSLSAAAIAVTNGAAIVRTHDVPETVQAVRIAQAARDVASS